MLQGIFFLFLNNFFVNFLTILNRILILMEFISKDMIVRRDIIMRMHGFTLLMMLKFWKVEITGARQKLWDKESLSFARGKTRRIL